MHPEFIQAIQRGEFEGLFEPQFDTFGKFRSYLSGKTTSSLFSEAASGAIRGLVRRSYEGGQL